MTPHLGFAYTPKRPIHQSDISYLHIISTCERMSLGNICLVFSCVKAWGIGPVSLFKGFFQQACQRRFQIASQKAAALLSLVLIKIYVWGPVCIPARILCVLYARRLNRNRKTSVLNVQTGINKPSISIFMGIIKKFAFSPDASSTVQARYAFCSLISLKC